jgi:hypothetical protein
MKPHRRLTHVAGASLLLLAISGCAANLQFVDHKTGVTYTGETGSTAADSGTLHATIQGEKYSGTWIYAPYGGSYSLITSQATAYGAKSMSSAFGTSTGISMSASGHGLVIMHGNKGDFIRCVFDFSSLSNTGTGECKRNDGAFFDLMIRKPWL